MRQRRRFLLRLTQWVIPYYFSALIGQVQSFYLTRCELATSLKSVLDSSEWGHIGVWICVAESRSGINTALNTTNTEWINGVKTTFNTYGVFQLSNIFNCNDSTSTQINKSVDICGKPCADFMDKNVTDDIKCGLVSLNYTSPNEFKEAYLNCSKLNISNFMPSRNCSVGLAQTIPKFNTYNVFVNFDYASTNQYFECVIYGNPPPVLHWEFDNATNPELKTEENVISGNHSKIRLSFPVIRSRFAGKYRCVAEYSGGTVVQKWDLKVKSNFNFSIVPVCFAIIGVIITLTGVALKIRNEYDRSDDGQALLGRVEEIEAPPNNNEVALVAESSNLSPAIVEPVASRISSMWTDQCAGEPSSSHLSRTFEGCPTCIYLINRSIKLIEGDGFMLEIYRKHIGDGISSSVHLGSFGRKGKVIKAAVKIIHKRSSSNTNYSHLEYEILKEVKGHPNIIQVLGFYKDESPTLQIGPHMYIALELCKRGCLKTELNFIRENYTIIPNNKTAELSNKDVPCYSVKYTVNHLLIWACQIAHALEYIDSKGILHGDVSARNILMFNSNLVKLSDFGHARRKTLLRSTSAGTEMESVPWRWRPPESVLTYSLTPNTDLWAFGITVWEIFSFGEEPYQAITRARFLKDRPKLDKPVFAPHELYELMEKCWHSDSESSKRITFSKLRLKLYGILNPCQAKNAGEYVDPPEL